MVKSLLHGDSLEISGVGQPLVLVRMVGAGAALSLSPPPSRTLMGGSHGLVTCTLRLVTPGQQTEGQHSHSSTTDAARKMREATKER